jgi:NADPH2:quinone reductase
VLSRAGAIFSWIAAGRLSVPIHNVYSLSGAAQAHTDLESRFTSGKLLLRP